MKFPLFSSQGKCFKCTSCQGYHLCNTCYHGNNHSHHTFVYKLKAAQRWRPVEISSNSDVTMIDSTLQPIVNELQGREITENDYDLLLQLDQ